MTASNLPIFILALTIAFFGASLWARKSNNPRAKMIITIMRVLILVLVGVYLYLRRAG